MEEMTVEEKEREIKELAEEARKNKNFFKLVSGIAFVTAGACFVRTGLNSAIEIGARLIFLIIGGILLFKFPTAIKSKRRYIMEKTIKVKKERSKGLIFIMIGMLSGMVAIFLEGNPLLYPILGLGLAFLLIGTMILPCPSLKAKGGTRKIKK